MHAEVTELLSNVIYQHRRRAGQGGRSPRKESPLGRAVVWRGWGGHWRGAASKAADGAEAENSTAVFSWTCRFTSPLWKTSFHNGIRPAIDRAFLPFSSCDWRLTSPLSGLARAHRQPDVTLNAFSSLKQDKEKEEGLAQTTFPS